MKLRLVLKKFAVSCIAGAMMLTCGSMVCSAASASPALPKAGATLETVVSEGSLPSAGFVLNVSTYKAAENTQPVEEKAVEENVKEAEVTEAENDAEPVKSEYANIAIAQVDGYVNVRENPDTDSEIIGKLYDDSAATVVASEGDWYEITSGSVHGYIKKQFVVVGDEYLAKAVGHRVAVVQAETLRVREKESVESDIISLVPEQEVLEVVSEGEGWVQVSVEEGDGYVSNDYVTCETRYMTAESKEEEEARIAEEEKAQEKEAKKAKKSAKKKNSESNSSNDSAASADASADEGSYDEGSASADAGSYDEGSASADAGSYDEGSASADAGSYDESSASPDSGSGSSDSASVSADSGSGAGGSVASFACQFVGNPYVWGGTSLTNGADCSGFVMSVYANFGVSLPHSSGAIAGCGVPVTDGNYQPGDVICYNGHVGIYIGNGQMVHASNSTNGIIISNYNYRSDIVSVRRFL